MKKFPVILTALAVLVGCSPGNGGGKFEALLAEADKWEKESEYAKAGELVMKALDEASRSGDRAAKANALCRLSAIDLKTWRDAQAWEHACEAEETARSAGIDTLTSDALFLKGQVCIFSNISENSSRDSEALGYFDESLRLAKQAGSIPRQIRCWYQISQARVNQNRFRNPPDTVVYRLAGEALAEGERLAREAGLPELLDKSFTFRIRYLRQGGKIREAVACCEQTFSRCKEDNYLLRSQVLDQMVMLEASLGDIEASAAAHQEYVRYMSLYLEQRAARLLQEMESRYDIASVEMRNTRLRYGIGVLLVILISVCVILIVIMRDRRLIARQNQALDAASRGKEQLLHLISRSFASPSSLEDFNEIIRNVYSMSETEIRNMCSSLFEGDADGIDREIADYLVELVEKRRSSYEKAGLTAREMDIIRCCRSGMSNSQIADALFISVSTVKNHKQSIFSKLDVHSQTEMLAAVERLGLA